jgi:hypothetical protein
MSGDHIMKIQHVIVAILFAAVSNTFAQDLGNAETGDNREKKAAEVTPFIFSFYDNADPNVNPFAERTTNFHLSIISGRVGSVRGLQLGGVINRVQYDFIGYDATWISSRVEGNFSGYQASGIYNRIDGNFVGVQDVGIYSHVGSDFLGVQSTGITNQVKGSFTGVQIAGISNYAKSVKGTQIVGIANYTKNVDGVQIAGIVNSGGRVHGVQIGLVNLSDELDGIAIGLVNISKAGSVHGIGWGGGASDISAGIKFAPNHYWYTIISAGRGNDYDENGASIGFYAGIHIPLVSKLYTELDIGTISMLNGDVFDDREFEDKAANALESRLSVGFRLAERISIFVGIVHTRIGEENDWLNEGKTDTSPFFGIQF